MRKWIILLLIIAPQITWSQGQQRIWEKGLEISRGYHHFILTKPNGKISDLAPLTKGVSTGFYFGNNLLQTRLRGVGYYAPTDVAEKPFSQFEAEGVFNLYPLEFYRTRKNILDVYLLAGINYTHVGFRQGASVNRVNQVGGVGVDWLNRNGRSVIRLFAEVYVGTPLTYSDEYESNSIDNIFSGINIGLRIGSRKKVKVQAAY
ncbi:MAG: hypothetical protein AB7O48_16840 [Cyclobacteriaceae bacterium]